MFVILDSSVSKEKPPPSFVYMTVSLDKETMNVKLSVLENGANLNGVLGKLHLLFNSHEKKNMKTTESLFSNESHHKCIYLWPWLKFSDTTWHN